MPRLALILPMCFGFLISLALIGFAITIYNNDHVTSLTIISVVGGHWLGVGTMVTGKSLSELASTTGVQIVKDAVQVVKESQQSQ